MSKRVNVDFLDATIEQALQLIFKGYDVKFEINDNFVVIHYVRALAVTDSLKKITVRGTVKDVDGMTLPGVTIQVKGTTIGFTTNEEGKFEFAEARYSRVDFFIRGVPETGGSIEKR